MPQYIQITLVGIAAMVCLIVSGMILYRNRNGKASPNWAAHLAEIVILCLGMLLLAGWANRGIMVEDLFTGYSRPNQESRLEPILVGAILYGVFALPILILSRFLRSGFLLALLVALWIGILTYRIYAWRYIPILEEVRQADVIGILKDAILLDTWILFPRIWIWALLAILGGFYAVRKSFSYTVLIIGVIATSFIVVFLMSPFTLWPGFWLAPFCFAAFTVLLVKLPLQRASLERLLGIRLTSGNSASPMPVSFWSNLGNHSLLLLAIVTIGASAFVNYFERIQINMLMKGAKPVWHSPAEHNAYDDLKSHFLKADTTPSVTAAKTPADYAALLQVTEQVSSSTRERLLTQIDKQQHYDYFQSIGEFIRIMQTASRADYLQMTVSLESPALSYLNLRETARAVARRAILSYHDSDTTSALKDTETLLRMGGLLHDQPVFVQQMVGMAVRNVGIGVTWNLLAMGTQDAPFLSQLAHTLNMVAPMCRVSVDYEALQRGEPAMIGSVIAPNMSVAMPAFTRAHYNVLASWMNFDLVMLGVALERYRLDYGSYPKQLSQLTPAYLERIPREPFEGREYTYLKKQNGVYEMYSVAYLEKNHDGSLIKQFPMPPLLATDDEDLKK